MADLAYDQAAAMEGELVNALAQCGWEGSYLIQVGFDEELLRLERGILQVIHIFLEFDLNAALLKRIAVILDPFPVTIHTSEEHHHVPCFPEDQHTWDLWILQGIYQPSIKSQAPAAVAEPMDGSEASGKGTGNSALSQTGSGGDSRPSGHMDRGVGSEAGHDNANNGGHSGGGDIVTLTLPVRTDPAHAKLVSHSAPHLRVLVSRLSRPFYLRRMHVWKSG
jgi:hypothetical protein